MNTPTEADTSDSDELFVVVDNVGRFDTRGRIAVTRGELAAIRYWAAQEANKAWRAGQFAELSLLPEECAKYRDARYKELYITAEKGKP